jgi:GT2 family glycosyltransferase
MKVAIYTLTRERLDYTKHCFRVLEQKAGYPFHHYVIDNGSLDGTPEWLKAHRAPNFRLFCNARNLGISKASNQALELIGGSYDLIAKFDNDCEVVTDKLLARIVNLYYRAGATATQYVLSPRVVGIDVQPHRVGMMTLSEMRIGLTSVVGGLFHVVPYQLYARYRYPDAMAKAQGQDQHFCAWVRRMGGKTGYVEDLVVNHYETTKGQALRYPEYFRRKRQEEQTP